jgi:aryl-alcohol dehydrogenase-like predicted oxidoreductase
MQYLLFMLDTSKLAIGTVQFGLDYGISNSDGKPHLHEIESILELAFESKIELLDTAIAYGEAQQIIGQINANRFHIVTKFLLDSQNDSFEKQFQNSLHNLKTGHLYGLLAHRPMDVVDHPVIWDKMNTLKYNQKIKKIGFSFDSPEDYYIVNENSFFPDIVQVPYNYFDDRFADIIKELKDKGCEIHVRSAFLQGLFFTNTNQLPTFFEEVKDLVTKLQKEHGTSLAAALLRFVLENKFVDKVVIGIQNRYQLQNILDSLVNAPKLKELKKKINHKILRPSLWPN